MRLLDVGTGSGILSIAALKLGIGHAVGTEVDEPGLENTADNAALNEVSERFEVIATGSPASVSGGPFPLVLANIISGILLQIRDELVSQVAPGGTLVLSGVLTREAALGEGLEGGFAGVYPVLRALEDQGKLRRGYFVAGLGAAQFALAGAVDRLRRDVDEDTAVVLAATDPGQPFGAALPWPEAAVRPSRSAGALVVMRNGAPLVFVERGGKSLITFPDAAIDPSWSTALADAVAGGRVRLEITKIEELHTADHWRDEIERYYC